MRVFVYFLNFIPCNEVSSSFRQKTCYLSRKLVNRMGFHFNLNKCVYLAFKFNTRTSIYLLCRSTVLNMGRSGSVYLFLHIFNSINPCRIFRIIITINIINHFNSYRRRKCMKMKNIVV